jgi:hypothetical protein
VDWSDQYLEAEPGQYITVAKIKILTTGFVGNSNGSKNFNYNLIFLKRKKKKQLYADAKMQITKQIHKLTKLQNKVTSKSKLSGFSCCWWWN